MDTIGKRINEVRKYFSLNQTQFAKELSVSPSFVSKVEKDKETLSDSLIKLICLTWGINENWLRDGTGNMLDFDTSLLLKLNPQNNPENTDIYKNAILFRQLATKYINLVMLLGPSGATPNNIPFTHYPELIDIINYLQFMYEKSDQREKIKIEVKFEQLFPDYKKVVSELKANNSKTSFTFFFEDK